jgi:hypothetical protein
MPPAFLILSGQTREIIARSSIGVPGLRGIAGLSEADWAVALSPHLQAVITLGPRRRVRLLGRAFYSRSGARRLPFLEHPLEPGEVGRHSIRVSPKVLVAQARAAA